MPKPLPPLSKRWPFTSVIWDTNVSCLCKIVDCCDKPNNGVMHTGEEFKSG